MIRSLVTFILGLAIGIMSAGKFSERLAQTPGLLEGAANSLGDLQSKSAPEKSAESTQSPQSLPAASALVGYMSSGPLAGSFQAEAERRYDDAITSLAAYQQ